MAPNQLNNFGMGLVTLPGEPPGLPRPFWILVTAAAVAGAALMILTLGALIRERWRTRGAAFTHESWPWQVVFSVVVGALTFGPIACSYGAVFDRYLLTFVPLLFGSIVALRRGVNTVSNPMFRRLSVLVMAVYLVFGVTATHDYLGWNRTRGRWRRSFMKVRVSRKTKSMVGSNNNLLHTRKRFETQWITSQALSTSSRSRRVPIAWRMGHWHLMRLSATKTVAHGFPRACARSMRCIDSHAVHRRLRRKPAPRSKLRRWGRAWTAQVPVAGSSPDWTTRRIVSLTPDS